MSDDWRWSLLDSPLIQELLTQRTHEFILRALKARFGEVPPATAAALRSIQDEDKLNDLVCLAAVCPDLASFHAQLGP